MWCGDIYSTMHLFMFANNYNCIESFNSHFCINHINFNEIYSPITFYFLIVIIILERVFNLNIYFSLTNFWNVKTLNLESVFYKWENLRYTTCRNFWFEKWRNSLHQNICTVQSILYITSHKTPNKLIFFVFDLQLLKLNKTWWQQFVAAGIM